MPSMLKSLKLLSDPTRLRILRLVENEALLRSTWEQAKREPDPSPENCLAETYRSGVFPAGYAS